jgi:hypothetical protein
MKEKLNVLKNFVIKMCVRFLRVLAGFCIFPIILILAIYALSIAPILWALTGNKVFWDIDHWSATDMYLEFVFEGEF